MTQSYTLTERMSTVFKIGDWGINKVDRGEYANIKVDSIIVHNCANVHSTADWDPVPFIIIQEDQLKNTCSYCGRICPDEIQALWRLQNMEKL